MFSKGGPTRWFSARKSWPWGRGVIVKDHRPLRRLNGECCPTQANGKPRLEKLLQNTLQFSLSNRRCISHFPQLRNCRDWWCFIDSGGMVGEWGFDCLTRSQYQENVMVRCPKWRRRILSWRCTRNIALVELAVITYIYWFSHALLLVCLNSLSSLRILHSSSPHFPLSAEPRRYLVF